MVQEVRYCKIAWGYESVRMHGGREMKEEWILRLDLTGVLDVLGVSKSERERGLSWSR